jgi:hypothetical protein
VKLHFNEPSFCRYIYINADNNLVHLMVPIVSGTSIGLDNTCKAALSLQDFFGKSGREKEVNALDELNRYKKALILDLELIKNTKASPIKQKDIDSIKQAKEERLDQINQYIKALEKLKINQELNKLKGKHPTYPIPVELLMESKESNV